jgi:2-oxoacid dehydrogenases acyltransferase (catalytic domain)
LSFDHRVTDGKTAGLFLADLKERLESYQSVETGDNGEKCGVCLKSLAEDAKLSGFGLVQRLNHRGEIDYICAVCLRGGG